MTFDEWWGACLGRLPNFASKQILKSECAKAWDAAVAAERAAWVAATREAESYGIDEQGWWILHKMGALHE